MDKETDLIDADKLLNLKHNIQEIKELNNSISKTEPEHFSVSPAILSKHYDRDKNQDRDAKKKLQANITVILYIEIMFAMLIVFFQSIGKIPLTSYKFSLNDYIFGIFINGVLVQTYFTVRIMVVHFFPKKDHGLT